MPSVTSVIQMRRRRRQRQQRNPSGRSGLGCSMLLALILAAAAVIAALGYSRVVYDLPSIETLPALLEPPAGLLLQPTRLVDRSGQTILLELKNPAGKSSVYLRLPGGQAAGPSFSPALITATLAAADPNFWQHSGFSFAGLNSDAATLAQRLASNLLLDGEPASLRRAIRERLLAVQITQRYGREKILEWYLNSADYGRLAYGADAAARVYLGKSAADLNLAEAALLAGAALAPAQNPHDAPQAALANQKRILEAALRHHLADPLDAAQAAQQTVNIRPVERPGQALRIDDLEPAADPLFLAIALQQAQIQLPPNRLLRGGLTIQTTLDDDLQQQIACALAEQLRRLEAGTAHPATGDCRAGLLLPALDPIETPPGGGEQDLSAQALILDPQSGQILALASAGAQSASQVNANEAEAAGPIQRERLGVDFADSGIFPGSATLSARPIGSLGAPWIYLTAFTRGLGPASLIWDIAPAGEAVAGDPGKGPMRLRLALANDYIRPAQQILKQVGAPNVWQTVRQFGLTAPENNHNGNGSTNSAPEPDALFRPMTLLELGQAYSVLANDGLLAGHSLTQAAVDDPPPLVPAALLRIDDNHGQNWLDWMTWQSRPIISADLAYLMNDVLSDEAARWPSLGRPNPLEIGRPAAAKIGRTLDGSDAWTMGYTTERLTGVWLGRPAGSTPGAETDRRLPLAAAGLYHAIMKYATQSLPVQTRPVPDGVQTVKVCDPSGMLPTAYCPKVVDEIFLEANRPLQTDRLYRSAAVNRETGRLATIFTPPDQVVEQSYLQVPAEAAEWAHNSGQKTPPETYDTVFPEQGGSGPVRITSPEMFAVVRGQVEIRGTAAIENLDFYRLQFGQGMNPRAWQQIGEDQPTAPGEEKLSEWDTGGLDGLYALELMAVDRDGGVQRAHVLVSVDNRPPQIEIISPQAQEEISLSERPEVVLLAEVEDNLGEMRVEMYLDGKRLIDTTAAPYAFLWTCTPGEHTLRVVAIDRAGNTTEVSTAFTVTP